MTVAVRSLRLRDAAMSVKPLGARSACGELRDAVPRDMASYFLLLTTVRAAALTMKVRAKSTRPAAM